jgi:hypothetical protein
MTQRDTLLLAFLGLAVVLVVAAFEASPGYMDADYYYAGGLQLASGNGFSEPYLWNYLDNPVGLPHPSHAYWMPLASILSAIIPTLFGTSSWFATRLPFYLITATLPPLTASLAYSITSRRSLALTSGLLAAFSGFYLPFLATTDTFALYMLFGGLFFLIIHRLIVERRLSKINLFLLGLLAGLMHLSRADGLLWLVGALLVLIFLRRRSPDGTSLLILAFCFLVTLTGYLMVMAPWFMQIFSYPASGLTFSTWWQSGLGDILQARLWAFGLNAANTFTVQGGIFLLPFIVIGLWHLRKDKIVIFALIIWLLTLVAMTLVFPFAGARGGFFHSGAALQIVWWGLAPVGLDRAIQWGCEHRGWHEKKARPVFLSGMVGLTVLFSLLVLVLRIPSWDQESFAYIRINAYLEAAGKSASDIVIVSNPPGFYLASSAPAIAVPDGNPETILNLTQQYRARYLILEVGSIPSGLIPVYENPQGYQGLKYLGEVEEARVYAIQP